MLSRDDAALVARDPAVTAFAAVLDADLLLERLARAAGPVCGQVDGVRVDYLRYKPSTSLTAGLVLATERGQQRAYAVAGTTALTAKLRKPVQRGARHPADFPPQLGADGLLLAPAAADRSLQGVRRLLHRPGSVVPQAEASSVLRYKPGRRLVARMDAAHGPVAFAKSHREGWSGPAASAATTLQQNGIRVPQVIRELRGGGLVVTTHLPGEVPPSGMVAGLQERAGRLLAGVHAAAPFSGVGRADHQLRAARSVRAVEALHPPAARLAREAASRALAALPHGTACLVHGDFSCDQLLVSDAIALDAIALVDLDQVRLDDPAADAASWFAAEVAAGRCAPDRKPEDALAPLLAGYAAASAGGELPALVPHAALALLARAAEPFRARTDAAWSERLLAMVGAAEALAARS
jgi:aminoglycoside phosphotransferase (APT) family kinase protein